MGKVKNKCLSVIFLGALVAGAPIVRAQVDSQTSVAEAARRAREQKKKAVKPSQVITNDTLKPFAATTPAPAVQPSASKQSASALSTGSAAAEASDQTGKSGAQSPEANKSGTGEGTLAHAKKSPEDEAAQKAALEALQQEIAEKQKEVDLAQRALTLANEDFYSHPDFSRDADGKAKLDAMQSDLAQKQDELAQLKAKLPPEADTQEEKPPESQATSQAQPQQP